LYKKLFEDKDIIKHILSKGGVTFLFRMFAMAFSFLSMLFITNFYGEAVFGRYSLALTILQISVMIFGLGIPYAFVSFTGEYNNDENKALGLLLKSLKIALISSLIPLFFYLIFASFISETIFSKPSLYFYIIILSVGIPFLIIHEIICYFFISIKKIVKYGLFLFVVPNLLFIIFTTDF
jgi:O-antigen/teichoic acid export membrane protein